MTRLTHLAGAETAGNFRRRGELYRDWIALVEAAATSGVPITEPYPPTPATPPAETEDMIARLRRAIEEYLP